MFALWQCKPRRPCPAHALGAAGRPHPRRPLHPPGARPVKLFGLEEHVGFLGPGDRDASLYHAADALLLPSLYEGMPNAAIEAQVSGLPAMVSAAANADAPVAEGRRVRGPHRG